MVPPTRKPARERWDAQVTSAGRVIRDARARKGWSQVRAADEIDAALQGAETVTQSTVSNWETGRSAPSPSKVAIIEDVLGIDPGTLGGMLYAQADQRPKADGDVSFEMQVQSRLAELAEAVRELADEVRRHRPSDPPAHAAER